MRKPIRDSARPPKVRPRPQKSATPRKDASPPKVAKRETVLEGFRKLWGDLFSSPVHLDSALSKQPKNTKSILARIVPTVLLRPASQAEALGIGMPAGEPWSIAGGSLAKWRPALLMAERMHEGMVHRPVIVPAVAEDFPPAMTDEWTRDWGADRGAALVGTLASEAPLSLRVSRRFKPEDVLRGLTEGSRLPVSAQRSDLSPTGLRLGGYAPVLASEWYEKGAFEIQDEGSQVMAYFALWPELFASCLSDAPGPVSKLSKLPTLPADVPAWTIVDACAGAGGKSLAFSDALRGKGRIFAYDTSEKKLLALRRRAKHAGYNNIQAVALTEGAEADALRKFRRTANVVLVDAPCSGWGVLRRNPDIKWRQGAETLAKMPVIQKRLLATYAELVASGGRLVFGVCTFRRAETRDVVEDFLSSHPEFKAIQGGFLGPGPCDGFFMQAFERSATGASPGRRRDSI